jgi:VWFA-related protein
VLFSVRNRKGTLVPGLTKDDFAIYEDGAEQKIRYFSKESDLPLTIGMLIDVSRSQENLIPQEREAGALFFQKVLRQKDMAFLISFGTDAELLQDLTNSHKLLRSGLEELRLKGGVGGLHPGPVPTSRQKGTILYDAVYLAATEKLRREVGRKALIVISDGADYGSEYSQKQAIEQAQKADVILYGIHYADPRYGWGDEGALRKMSEETGGRTISVGRSRRLEEAFSEIEEEMRTQYAIAYAPTNDVRGSFRKLEIKPADKSLKIQARKGYYATAKR